MYIYTYICISVGVYMCMYMYVCMHIHLDTQVDGLFADYSSCNYIKTSGLRFFLSLLFSVSRKLAENGAARCAGLKSEFICPEPSVAAPTSRFAAVTPSNLQKPKPGGGPISLLFLILFQQYVAAKPQS